MSMDGMGEKLTEMILSAPLEFLEFGRVHYPPGGRCGPRPQHMFQLVLLLQGSAHIEAGDMNCTVPAGHVALQRPAPREYFQFSETTDTVHTWLMFAVGANSPLERALAAAPRVLPVSPRLADLVDEGDRLGGSTDPFTAALRVQLARAVLLEYMRGVHEGSGPARHHPQAVLRALAHIERHYRAVTGLEELCEVAHVTPGHLIRLFRRHLGTTPVAYLWGTRIQRATQLIVNSGLRMAEVADQTGFQSPAHLSRAIKQRHGVSPRTLRAMAQGAS